MPPNGSCVHGRKGEPSAGAPVGRGSNEGGRAPHRSRHGGGAGRSRRSGRSLHTCASRRGSGLPATQPSSPDPAGGYTKAGRRVQSAIRSTWGEFLSDRVPGRTRCLSQPPGGVITSGRKSWMSTDVRPRSEGRPGRDADEAIPRGTACRDCGGSGERGTLSRDHDRVQPFGAVALRSGIRLRLSGVETPD